ncbi:hypothetical protein B9Z55_006198 [Caenorhabditis nigoni]|uniref:Uncharacterized protein n=1 Tax=Caenorhabditis nigoni TaxID=1611254 RepID=A0A2G5V429_9PELO|nr:hypothetical protein B9Z55_006198 [Caenorhabditis nigoni]
MVLSQSHLNHPHHHLHHHDHFDSNDRSFLSILTDPIVSLFRSIPIEILDQNEELSPSQKDFLDDFVEIRIECKEDDPTELLQFDGQLISEIVVDVLSDILDKVEEMEQDETLKTVEIPEIIVEETASFPCIDIVVQSFNKLQDIPVELTDSGLFSDIDDDDSSDFGIDEPIPVEIFEPEVSATTSCSFIRSQSSARCKIILLDTSFICTLPPISATFSAPVITPKKVIKRK